MDSDFFEDLRSQLDSFPSKLNFKIGEVSHLLGVKAHVLRYWEEEFSLLKPKKFHNGQRLYFKKDLEIVVLIKGLLYKKKYSIKGVKENLFYYHREFKRSFSFEKKHQGKGLEKKLTRILEGISATRKLLEKRSSL